MKKIFALTIAVLLTLPLMAGKKISPVVFGLELGKSTHSQVLAVVHANSQSVDDNISTIICRRFAWKNRVWDTGVFGLDSLGHLSSAFMSDTLPLNNKALYDDLLSELQDVYGMAANSDAMNFLSATMGMAGVELTRGFTLFDGDNYLAIGETKEGAVMFQLFCNAGGAVMEVSEMAKKDNPNYDPANRVTGVAGFAFGDTKQSVRSKMYSNSAIFLEDDGRVLTYSNFSLAGNVFSSARFYFADSKGGLVLVAAHFEKNFEPYEKSRAQSMYESVAALYKRKYSNFYEGHMGDEFPLALCGMKDANYDDQAPISMYMTFSESKGGKKFYYVILDYYYDRQLSIYNDDI